MHNPIRAALAAAALCVPALAAAGYPQADKPIRFIVGFPAGSTIDNVSRVVVDDIRARTGAQIVVENKPGALGVLGVDAVARAAPDGYTMMPSSSATSSSGPYLSKAFQRYDAIKDFTQVGRVVRFDVVIVTRASGSYGDARQLVAAARQKPQSVTSGYGSGTGQVVAAAFSRAAGAEVLGVPYKGQPAAVTDLLGGRIDFVAADLGAVLPQIRAQNLNAVALVSSKRSTILPAVPTAGELGMGSLDLTGWIGVAGPAGLAPEAAKWWADQLSATMRDAAVQERLRAMGMEPDLAVGEPLQQFVRSQYEAWGEQIRQAGIQPE
ncbi:tripartite tricarboxylate transporter substrate binding protein [Achromobacter xylosoxidans]|nr:tripartite tricarboxylate transporter substrate binding protein [Achromobacter xylosoxidans]